MAFEKSVLSIVAYGLYLTQFTSIDLTIHARHAHGLFAMKCITMCSDMNIYTPSVFCYDEHKKNFDIHFSMKKHT